MASTHLYQIFYSEQTRAQLDPGFIPLDNSANRPAGLAGILADPGIFLLNNELVDGDYYGFFSPKFQEKTRLTAAQVKEFILEPGHEPDVVIFSPMWDMSAFFQNVFEQTEIVDLETGQALWAFFQKIRPGFGSETWITDSRNTSFCNYFAAKPAFWRAWLKIGEELFELAERGEGELAEQVNGLSNYGQDARRKVFIMERIATFLLASEKHWKARAANPFRYSASPSVLREFHLEAVISDALKIAYSVQPFIEYRDAFVYLRNDIKKRIDAKFGKGK